MRAALFVVLGALVALKTVRAQNAMVAGQVFAREVGAPLGSTTIAVMSQGIQYFTGDSGTFALRNLVPGKVHLRFKRIGFAPMDTILTLAANDTARIRIEMTRLAIRLPVMMVSGKCTERAPFEEKPAILAELFEQVKQNAEQVRLLTTERPFVMRTVRVRGDRMKDNRIAATRIDTVVRRPLPEDAYVPKRVLERGDGVDASSWVVRLPELPDFADTAFTNNHCLQYAGQTRFESDSVIRVDFEPVPWLDKNVDIKGSIYLRVDDYQLVAMFMKLNKIPSQFRGLREFSVRARFAEVVTGVPALSDWELTNTFRDSRTPPRVEVGQVISLAWLDSATTIRTTAPRQP